MGFAATRWAAALLMSCLPGVIGPLRAQDTPLSWGPATPVGPADATAVRQVIAAQLDAFARNDRAGAYAATAPNVRHKFPTADTFDAMARASYDPLFTARRETFGPVRGAAATPTHAETWSQSVEIDTHDGARWTAVYGLERQPDGSIAITSCVLIRRGAAAA